MLSLQIIISLGSNPLSSPRSPTLIRSRAPFSQQSTEEHETASAPPLHRRRASVAVRAVDKRDQQSGQSDYEIDEDKAREALEQLDRRLQSLSRKRVPAPKVKGPDIELGRDQMLQDEAPEMSGSFLTYSAVALLFFSILYNVLFYAVIKPSVDGPNMFPESDDASMVRTEIRF